MNASTIEQAAASSGFTFDFSITITVILAVCAIFSPIIVAIINNRHQRKMRELEIKYEGTVKRAENVYNHALRRFEAYISSLESYIKVPSAKNKEQYGKAFGSALLYVSFTTHSKMCDIDDIIRNAGLNNVQSLITSNQITEISLLLMAELQEYKDREE